ncbi:MAG TPA: MFS transporter [Micromonosporaceae bacterium]|nr:MFS transporter [Micromonosporaceae bacterium]
MRRDLSIFHHRRFVLLFGARTSAVLGASIGPVALAFGILGLPHGTPTELSIVLAAESVAILATLLIGGVVADRLPRYRVMYASDGLSAVSWAAIGVMLLSGWAPVGVLVVWAVAAGVGTGMFWPAMTGVIPEVSPPGQLQAANAFLRLGENGSRILGVAIAGAMVALVGAGSAMLIDAGGFLVSALLLGRLRLPRTGTIEASNIISDLREGWREFTSRQWLWVVVAQFSILVGGLEAFYGVLGPVVAKQELGGAPSWSIVLGGESIGMLLGVVIAIRIRPRRPILFGVLLTFPLALAPLLLGLRAPVLVVAAGALIGGLCIDIFAVLWETSMQRSVPEAALSRVSSYDALGSLLLGPIGIVVAGPLAAWLGARHALLVVAASVVVPTALALLAPGVRTMQMPAETPAAESVADVAQPPEPGAVVAPVSLVTAEPAESVAQA